MPSLCSTTRSLCLLEHTQMQTYKHTCHTGGTPHYAHWGESNENNTVACKGPVVNRKKSAETQVLFGLFTTFVQTTKHLRAKSALALVHALLGVSHSWWALEIAWFLSRWCWADPNSLTSLSGVARLWGLCRVQQAICCGPGSFIFSSWYPFYAPVQSTIDSKGKKKGNLAILETNSVLKKIFFPFLFSSGAKPDPTWFQYNKVCWAPVSLS